MSSTLPIIADMLSQKYLDKATKKVIKAYNQIKIINKKITELYEAYSQCDDEANNFNSTAESNNNTTTTQSNNVLNPMRGFYTQRDREAMSYIDSNFNAQLMRDFLLCEIEGLKNLKLVYMMYARRKAHEIKFVQSELSSDEEVLREAADYNNDNHEIVDMSTSSDGADGYDSFTNNEYTQDMFNAEEFAIEATQTMLDESDSSTSLSSSSSSSSSSNEQQSDLMSHQDEFRPLHHHQSHHHFIDNPVF
jgi:hypothetical protein